MMSISWFGATFSSRISLIDLMDLGRAEPDKDCRGVPSPGLEGVADGTILGPLTMCDAQIEPGQDWT